MAESDRVQFYLRFLNERFEAFKFALDSLLQILSLDDRSRKVEACRSVLQSLEHLKKAISEEDHPPWFAVLEQQLNWYVGHHKQDDAGLKTIKTIMQLNPMIESEAWTILDTDQKGVDFAGIYHEYYSSSQIPKLFDEILGLLTQVIESDEIDSRIVISNLEDLVVTIRRNSRGDYLSTRGSWEFARAFLTNFTFEFLEDIPGFGAIVKALRKTMTDLDIEMTRVHQEVRAKLAESIPHTESIPLLEYEPVAVLDAPSEVVSRDQQIRSGSTRH